MKILITSVCKLTVRTLLLVLAIRYLSEPPTPLATLCGVNAVVWFILLLPTECKPASGASGNPLKP